MSARAWPNRWRLLVVDDDQVHARLLRAILDRPDHELIVTRDSSTAIELCSATQPDLVLLDLHMPAPDGFELLDALPPETSGAPLPVVVLTADSAPETRRRVLEAGAHDILLKPFDPVEVRLRVRNILRMRAMAARLHRLNEELAARVDCRTFELQQSRLEMLRRLGLAADFRDDETGDHTQRVARTAAMLARAIELDDAQVRTVELAAPLHDVGKVAVPDEILLKSGPLSPDERCLMQTHTAVGEHILGGSNSDVLQVAAEIALSHHERWDGGGYPLGLGGDEIPLSARIVAIADVFDALIHQRPYKPAWSTADAIEEMQAQRGKQFDPSLLDEFLALDRAILLEPVGLGTAR